MTTLGANHMEMTRSFTGRSQFGVRTEEALAGTLFQKLQDAGYIPEGHKMADHPGVLDWTSYEGHLIEQIQDRDGNGKLDVDLDALRNSGMLTGNPSVGDLQDALSGANPGLTDEFVTGQRHSTGWSYQGTTQPAGEHAQRLSRGIVLTTDADRQLLDGAASRIANGEGRAVANEALMAAQVARMKGDSPKSRQLLLRTADALQQGGAHGDAQKVLKELGREHGGDTLNIAGPLSEDYLLKNPDFNGGRNFLPRIDGNNRQDIDVEKFDGHTYGEVVERRMAQSESAQKMSQVLGRPADPTNVDDAKAYFQAISTDMTTDEVGAEFQKYLKTHFAHPGGVTWDENIPLDERPARLNELLADQPRLESGETLCDCEGYTYLTKAILGDLRDSSGEQRFDVLFAGRPRHVVAGVFERETGAAFGVDNTNVSNFEGALDSRGAQVNAMRDFIVNDSNRYAVGRTPSAANPQW